jgi:hypothetical protein
VEQVDPTEPSRALDPHPAAVPDQLVRRASRLDEHPGRIARRHLNAACKGR